MEKDIESLEFEFLKALSLNYAGSNTHFFDFMDDSFTKGDERKLRRKYKDRINIITLKNC